METTHGRKVIRKNRKNVVVRRRFAIFTAVVLAIGILIGAIAGSLITKAKQTPVETESATPTAGVIDAVMQNVKQYGSYDGRTFDSEVSRDWSAGDLDFTPLDCGMDEGTQEFVFYLCAGYNIDWTLVMALIEHESSYQADAVSSTGDYGLMQINEKNHEWLTETLGVTDYLDSEQNIRAGVFVLRKLFEEYTDPELVLMCYNMGEDGASKLWAKGIYSTAYSESILKIQEGFTNQLKGE